MALVTQVLLLAVCVIAAQCTDPPGILTGEGLMGPGLGVGLGAFSAPWMIGPIPGGMMEEGMVSPDMMEYKDREKPKATREAYHRPTDKLPDEVANDVYDSKRIQWLNSRANPIPYYY